MCGQRDGTVHLLELENGKQKSIWLCSICAAGRAELSLADLAQELGGEAVEPAGEPAALASFLAQIQDPEGPAKTVAPCPRCGYELKMFQDTNRLGCPGCYAHFRSQVLPVLARYHRHASHLGKVPRQAGGTASRQGTLTRLRVALEKAIQGEKYEEAARLRDMIRLAIAERDQRIIPHGEHDPS